MNRPMLKVHPLTQAEFVPYGDVIETKDRDSFFINNDMAERFHALAKVDINGEGGQAVISLVKSKQYELPRKVDHLEHHPLGSQAFIPVNNTAFIVVVAKAGKVPSVDDLRAFITDGQQGINYHPATWHHVLLTPFAPMTFICVDRVGPGDNCIDFMFDQTQQVQLDIELQQDD